MACEGEDIDMRERLGSALEGASAILGSLCRGVEGLVGGTWYSRRSSAMIGSWCAGTGLEVSE
jgi:hypothetical protein